MGRGSGKEGSRDVLLGKNHFSRPPKPRTKPRVPIKGYDRKNNKLSIPLKEGNLIVGNIHSENLCKNREHCFIHNPSDHHMRDWEINYRSPEQVERICPHGVGHPDPDVADFLHSIDKSYMTTHGCCAEGCCDPKSNS